MPGREDYEERRQTRIDRLNAAAERESSQAAADYKRSHDMVKNIPLGQPNIEGRPALPRLRERSIRAFESSIEHDNKAAYYADRAEAAKNNSSISSDDPASIEKLEAKVAALEKKQQFMKAVNQYYRKHKTLDGCPDLTEETRRSIESQWENGWYAGKPFPPYELSNNNQRIKAAKDRIEKLRRIDQMPAELITFNGGEIESDPITNRIIIRFENRPDDNMMDSLRGNGFHWSPSITAWTRLRNPNALAVARRLCGVK